MLKTVTADVIFIVLVCVLIAADGVRQFEWLFDERKSTSEDDADDQ